MKVLAIDTSTPVMSIAVLEKKKLLSELSLRLDRAHSVKLIPCIADLLKSVSLTVHDIDMIGVTSGPGSYTGVRVGVTVAKMLSWSLNIALYSFSTLFVLASGVRAPLVIPIINARRGRVYTAIFRHNNQILEDQVINFDELISEVQVRNFDEPILFLGEDAQIFKEQAQACFGDRALFSNGANSVPRAAILGELTYLKHLAGGASETICFAPNYLQLTEAERGC